MKNFNSTHKIAIFIGVLGVLAGIYGAISGQKFSQYFITLVIGASLAGIGIINSKNQKRK